jgi:hypothetical protein
MDELLERVRELAERLAFEHFEGPPVNPAIIAWRRGMRIRATESVPHWSNDDRAPTIYLPERLPPERQRFVLAHEVLEIEAARASPPFPMTRELGDRAEWLFQLGASELLMPRPWFEAAGADSGWNLRHLHERFEVSWEAAARRVPICTPAVCTIVDNETVTARVGSQGLQFPRALAPLEQEAVSAVYEAWPEADPQRRGSDEFHCDAWPALPERAGIRRVCLLTYPVEE